MGKREYQARCVGCHGEDGSGGGHGPGILAGRIRSRQAVSDAEITRVALLAMIEEGLHILAEGIARRPADIDLVLVHGYGFPRWRGGPMHMADRIGLAAVRDQLAALSVADPLSWRVPDILNLLVDEGRSLSSLD